MISLKNQLRIITFEQFVDEKNLIIVHFYLTHHKVTVTKMDTVMNVTHEHDQMHDDEQEVVDERDQIDELDEHEMVTGQIKMMMAMV